MKTIFTSAMVAMILTAGTYAQQGSFGAGLAIVAQFPAGDFENSAGFGYGGMGGILMGGESVHLTARSGYLRHFERGDREVRFIPVLAGLRASAGDGAIYLAGEVGPVFTHSEYVGALPLVQDTDENNLGWGIGVGSAAGPFDIRFMFNAWDARHLSRSMTVGLSFGITAWSY